jgi:hypothetical protein
MTLRSVTSGHILPNISVENAFLPAVVSAFGEQQDADDPNPFVILAGCVRRMLSGDNKTSICFPQIGEAIFSRIVMEPEYDVFGFNEKIFIESLNKTVLSSRAVKLRTDWMAIPPTQFEHKCVFRPAAPSACVLLMLFDARRADADKSLLFPEAKGDFKGNDYQLCKFLQDVREDERTRLTQIGEATGKSVQQVLQALLTGNS